MSGTQFPHTLCEETSNVVRRIPDLLRRLRYLENEEAELNAKARQLAGLKGRPSTPSRPAIATSSPVSMLRRRPVVSTTTEATPGTPPHADPKNIETPVKTFLLMQSFALAMSIKSKRKGRIFMTGDSTELGEKI